MYTKKRCVFVSRVRSPRPYLITFSAFSLWRRVFVNLCGRQAWWTRRDRWVSSVIRCISFTQYIRRCHAFDGVLLVAGHRGLLLSRPDCERRRTVCYAVYGPGGAGRRLRGNEGNCKLTQFVEILFLFTFVQTISINQAKHIFFCSMHYCLYEPSRSGGVDLFEREKVFFARAFGLKQQQTPFSLSLSLKTNRTKKHVPPETDLTISIIISFFFDKW